METKSKRNPHSGSTLEDWLRDEGILDDVKAEAKQRIKRWQLENEMGKKDASTVFNAKVRCAGKPYADKTPNLFIDLPKDQAAGLPFQVGQRVPFRLRVANCEYDAGLLATPRHPNVWVSARIYDSDGERLTLGSVLTNAGFRANDSVRLVARGSVIEVSSR